MAIEGEDYDPLKEILWHHTVNCGHLFDESSVDYGYDNSQSTDDDHLDIEPPTGVPFKPEDCDLKTCYPFHRKFLGKINKRDKQPNEEIN